MDPSGRKWSAVGKDERGMPDVVFLIESIMDDSRNGGALRIKELPLNQSWCQSEPKYTRWG